MKIGPGGSSWPIANGVQGGVMHTLRSAKRLTFCHKWIKNGVGKKVRFFVGPAPPFKKSWIWTWMMEGQVETIMYYSELNPNLTTGLVGKVRKKTISRRRKEGRVEKKSARGAPAGPGARTRDLSRARRGSLAARHGGCLDKQAFPCL